MLDKSQLVFNGRQFETLEALQAEAGKHFNKVANPENWKLRCHGWIDPADFAVVAEAVKFHAGSKLERTGRVNADGMIEVTAPGYYADVGA